MVESALQNKSTKAIHFTCPLCAEVVTSRYSLPMHFRWKHPGKKHCPECLEVMNADELPAHTAGHRSRLRPCPICHQEMHPKSIGGHIASAHGCNAMKNPEVHKRAMAKRSENQDYRDYLSNRMKAKNPMSSDASRSAMRGKVLSLQQSGELLPFGNQRKHGNGGAPTEAEATFLQTFPQALFNHAVSLGDGERPFHYKIDAAFVEQKIAVEIDGTSHVGREEADRRKDARLSRIGWTVLRMTNEDVLSGKFASLLLPSGITPASSTTSK